MRYAACLFATAFLLTAPAITYAQDAAPAAAPAEAAPATKTFSDAEKAAIQDIIKDYLTKERPETLMEAMQELQKRESVNADVKSKQAITSSKDKIFNDPNSPVGGNPKGDVTVVEFFDYQCGYCKMSNDSVEKLLKDDKNVRFVYKEFPILGPMSTQLSKAALASVKQGKYEKFHDALMSKKEQVNEDALYQIAKDSGLDVEKLKKDMKGDDIDKMIKANIELGQQVGVRGTPMFIIGEKSYPGALQPDQLKKAVEEVRAGAKK